MLVSHIHILIVQLIAVALGTAVTAIAANAYRKHGEGHLRDATIAFALMTVAVVTETIAHHFTVITIHDAQVVDGVLLAIAFFVFLFSLRR